ncbi:TNF receptor-associated factor 5-like [Halichondria panicea]|uniref:TNF receptor-associated factor 5-like n=1 Tax=Halichondria panicea TaxID=6063 RepID=UPI00312B506E
MATSNSDCSNSVNQEPAATHPPEQITQQAEPDYDLVEQPDKDLYCPVTLEILVEPHQTDCCGQHISEKAAQRIIRDGKPCPMCNNAPFKTLKDKFFKRNTINKLNVRCPHKKSGCEWTGELGDLNHHTTSCLKRPWKCQYCDFESTHDIGTNNHTPCCDNYPLPCPNQCEIGTFPRCQADSHILECPLQLVECKFAGAGCDVKVPRRDLVGHMTESVQQHLLTATLLNLQLTRELHQKMEEKDQQIVDLQKRVKEQGNTIDTKIQQLDAKVDTKFQQQKEKAYDLHTKVATKFENLDTKFQDLQAIVDTKADQQARNLDTKVSDLKVTMEANTVKIQNDLLLLLKGFSCHEFTLTEFTKQQAKGGYGYWNGGEFTTKGWRFSFCVYTNGAESANGTHLTVSIYKRDAAAKTEGVSILQMLNQLGDHGHYIGTETRILKENRICFGDSYKFCPLDRLGYCAGTNTQYLKDDCLKFKLFMKVKAL